MASSLVESTSHDHEEEGHHEQDSDVSNLTRTSDARISIALGESGVDLADVPLSQCSGHVSALQENCGSDNDFVRII